MMIIIALLLIFSRGIIGLEEINTWNDSHGNVEIFSGFRLGLRDQELQIKLDLEKMLLATAMESRTHHNNQNEKKPGGLMERFGSVIVMIPLIMQMLSLPGAIASIKMSLLKSLLVAKLAILVMIFNIIRNQRANELVVVHQPPPLHHDHFYNHFHDEHEDDDKGWFG